MEVGEDRSDEADSGSGASITSSSPTSAFARRQLGPDRFLAPDQKVIIEAHFDAGADHVAVQMLADRADRIDLDGYAELAPALADL